jgi:uncharacterized RDD family membrane protein YckC
MNVRHFRWVILPLVVVAGGFAFLSHLPYTLGFSAGTSTDAGFHISAGSAPWALEASAVYLLVYLLLMFAPQAQLGEQLTGWWRRFSAFWIDFLFLMTILAPTIGFIPVYMEWRRTGVYVWAFKRVSPAPGDTVTIAITTVLMIVMFLSYFVLPLVRARPSPGTCVMGFQIVRDDGGEFSLATALKRTVAGFTFLGDRHRPVARIDSWFGTHAARLK